MYASSGLGGNLEAKGRGSLSPERKRRMNQIVAAYFAPGIIDRLCRRPAISNKRMNLKQAAHYRSRRHNSRHNQKTAQQPHIASHRPRRNREANKNRIEETERDREEQRGTERDRGGQRGTERGREGQRETETDRERQKGTEPAR